LKFKEFKTQKDFINSCNHYFYNVKGISRYFKEILIFAYLGGRGGGGGGGFKNNLNKKKKIKLKDFS
jgi:hypothetical protein